MCTVNIYYLFRLLEFIQIQIIFDNTCNLNQPDQAFKLKETFILQKPFVQYTHTHAHTDFE